MMEGQMTARSTLQRLALAVLLPLLTLAVWGQGYDRYRCSFSGQVETEDDECCPAREQPAPPSVHAAPCCDRETAQVTRPPAELTTSHASFEAPTLPAGEAEPPARASHRTLAAAKTAPPPAQTPLLLAKQSLLI
jgi:hypothetical protein